MGSLIPNPHDDSLKRKLDKQFSDPKLRHLRDRIDKGNLPTEPYFFSDPGNTRHLARIAYRLKISPDPDPQAGEPPPTAKQLEARWQYLLQVSLTDPIGAAQNGSTVAELIRTALEVFVVTDDPQCTAITFDVTQAPLPGALQYQVNITPALNARPAGNYVANIQLVCCQEIAQGASAPDPGPDPGEVPPSQPDFDKKSKPKPKPKPKKPPKKGPAKKTTKKKKKAAKKMSKKTAKKAGKKAVKKAAKKKVAKK